MLAFYLSVLDEKLDKLSFEQISRTISLESLIQPSKIYSDADLSELNTD